jgi:hypothetical protein
MGLVADWPSLKDYEKAVQGGVALAHLMLRCEIKNVHGQILSTGSGARSLSQDRGDLNKSIKMCCKSSFVAAVRNLGGLSAMFTIDLDDMPTEEELQKMERAVPKGSSPAPGPAPAAPGPAPEPAEQRPAPGGRRASEKQAKAIWSSVYGHMSADEGMKMSTMDVKVSDIINEFCHWFIGVESLKDVDAETATLFIGKYGWGKGHEEFMEKVFEFLKTGKK